jgi:hypothetical protein
MYEPSMTFTILSGRWVGDSGCPAKSSIRWPRYSSGIFLPLPGASRGISGVVPKSSESSTGGVARTDQLTR